MSSYEEIFKRFKVFDRSQYEAVLTAKIDSLFSAYKEIPKIQDVFNIMVMTTIESDGVYDDSEIGVITKALSSVTGNNIDEVWYKNEALRLMESYDVVSVLTTFAYYPEYIRDEIVICCLIMAFIDDDYAEDEEQWIRELAF